MRRDRRHAAFSLVELLLALALAGLLMVALWGVLHQALQAHSVARDSGRRAQAATFALERVGRMVRGTHRLLLPLPENPATAWSESVRDPGVLAVALPVAFDRDQDGFADADNDRDGQVDEDPPPDLTKDGAAGIVGVDDDNDGTSDEGGAADDDEDGVDDEDPWDGVDNDGDGVVDEDCHGDANGDGVSGVAGEDDDGDGSVDEDHLMDDDEDGSHDEDWIDAVVYYLNGTDLVERLPNLDSVDGGDYAEQVIADHVATFRVERIPGARAELVEITLELAAGEGDPLSLSTRLRVGGGP